MPVLKIRNLIGLGKIGVECSPDINGLTGGLELRLIYLLKKKPLASTEFPYLIAADNYHDLARKEVDLVEISDIDQHFYEMVKRSSSKHMGFEIAVNKLRTAKDQKLANKIALIKTIHGFAEKYGNQLVLTSGASSVFEMVSGRCFDALLTLCDIKPETYWNSLNKWLEYKIGMRCYTCDA